MSRRFNRLSSVTGSLILLIAGSGTANAGLLGSLLGGFAILFLAMVMDRIVQGAFRREDQKD